MLIREVNNLFSSKNNWYSEFSKFSNTAVTYNFDKTDSFLIANISIIMDFVYSNDGKWRIRWEFGIFNILLSQWLPMAWWLNSFQNLTRMWTFPDSDHSDDNFYRCGNWFYDSLGVIWTETWFSRLVTESVCWRHLDVMTLVCLTVNFKQYISTRVMMRSLPWQQQSKWLPT